MLEADLVLEVALSSDGREATSRAVRRVQQRRRGRDLHCLTLGTLKVNENS